MDGVHMDALPLPGTEPRSTVWEQPGTGDTRQECAGNVVPAVGVSPRLAAPCRGVPCNGYTCPSPRDTWRCWGCVAVQFAAIALTACLRHFRIAVVTTTAASERRAL